MLNNCFTCSKQNYCLKCWMGFENPNNFTCENYEFKEHMIIDCNKPDEVYDLFFNQHRDCICAFLRGSKTYSTDNENSDFDFGVIVNDDCTIIDVEGVFDNAKSDRRIHPVSVKSMNCDLEIVKESDFIDMISEHEPFAIEPLMLTNNTDMFKKFLKINPWKMRCRFGAISNNSWAKAKKKMTVEKDLDEYCGVKSLFHSIRLLMFICYFLKGYITNDELICVQLMYEKIMNDWKSGFKWEDFKQKYKPIYNNWHSQVVQMCPRPEEEFKSNKK